MVPMKLRGQTVGAAEQELGVLDAQAAQQHGQAVDAQTETAVRQLPPKGELFAVTAQFPDKMQALRMRQKLPLSGELANPKDLTERVSPPF